MAAVISLQPFSSALRMGALAVGLGILSCAGPARAQAPLTPPDAILAHAALLEDQQTGAVLYQRNPTQRLLPASTTKLMTALIAYDKLKGFNGKVKIVDDDRAEFSHIPVVPGETISVDTLFHALLIDSDNDAARALGRYVAGSTNAFVAMMNDRARAMGLLNTHFYNPNGLPAPTGTHYTSCADLMQIFKKVISYPELAHIMSTREYVIHTASGTHDLKNHNKLLVEFRGLPPYPGMGPAKTGWTVAARHTYACAVTRGGHTLLLTLLDSTDKWTDARILFNWGFAKVQSGQALSGASH